MNTTTYKIRFSIIWIVLGTVCAVPMAMGADLTIPKSWVADETLTATDLNGNFQAGKTAVDDNNARITAIETVNARGDGSSLDAPDGDPVDALSVDNEGTVNIPGKLGVGRTPIQQFSVEGALYSTFGAKFGAPTSEGSRGAFLGLRNTIPWASVISASNQDNLPLFNLSNSGNVTVAGSVTAASHITVSDSRYKKNIVSLETPLDTLIKLRGVTFEWDMDKHARFKNLPGKQVGFIAQEVKNVLPETVFKNKEGYLAVSYNAMIPLLVEAVKEQHQLIEELKKEMGSIEAIRTEMRALRQELSVIQTKNDDRHPVDGQRLSMINNK